MFFFTCNDDSQQDNKHPSNHSDPVDTPLTTELLFICPQLSTRLLQDLTKSYMTNTWVHPQLSTRLLQDLTKSYMTSTWVHPQFFVIRLFSFLCGVFVLFLSVFILCIVPNVVYVSGLSLLDSHFNIPLRSSKTNLSFHVNRCFTLMDFKCNHFLAMWGLKTTVITTVCRWFFFAFLGGRGEGYKPPLENKG